MNKVSCAKQFLCVVLAFAIFIAGCAGQAANPVDRYMMGDENKPCNSLYAEVAQIDEDIVLHQQQKSDRDTWNVILFVGGLIIIVPFFFMDIKNSQEIEIEAFRARKNALMNLYHSKNCDAPTKAVGQYMSDPSVQNAPQVDATGRKILGWRIDTSQKGPDGGFLKTPVYEDEEKK